VYHGLRDKVRIGAHLFFSFVFLFFRCAGVDTVMSFLLVVCLYGSFPDRFAGLFAVAL
jgi:hypothetical protein